MVLNYPEEDLNLPLVLSTMVYASVQCGLMNDIGSIVKDKDSAEINYYNDVDPKKSRDSIKIHSETIEFIEAVKIPDHIKTAIKSIVNGHYLTSMISDRFHGQVQANF
jgi:hypothetical protein